MASVLRIVDPNGKTINVLKGQNQSWAEVVNKANLPARFDYCLRHWMEDEDIDAKTEEMIKSYLDRVGYILIQDKPDASIITDYKELRDKVALIPASGYPQLENMFYGSSDETVVSIPGRDSSTRMTKAETKVYNALTKPRKIPTLITEIQERRERIDKMREAHPGCVVDFVVVDTENMFVWNGHMWEVGQIWQYKAKLVHGELLFDMDHIACICDGDNYYFYDQEYVDITNHVAMLA